MQEIRDPSSLMQPDRFFLLYWDRKSGLAMQD